jgi:hypothetical protein
MGDGFRFVNEGTVNMISTSATISCVNSCSAQFVNDGELVVSMGHAGNVGRFDVALSGSGDVTVANGYADFSRGGEFSGKVTVSETAVFRCSGGSLKLSPTSQISGKGRLEAFSGTLVVEGEITISKLRTLRYGHIQLTATAQASAPFESIWMEERHYDMSVTINVPVTVATLYVSTGRFVLNAATLTVTDLFHVSYRADFSSAFEGAKLSVKSWLWTGGTVKVTGTGTLRVSVQDVAQWSGTSTRYLYNGLVEIEAASVVADYTSSLQMDAGARLVLLNGTHMTCQRHCDFISGELVVEKEASVTVEDTQLVSDSTLFQCKLQMKGAVRSVGRVDLNGAANIHGELTLTDGAVLEVSESAQLTLETDAVVNLDSILVKATYNSIPVKINSRRMSLRVLQCTSSYYTREVIFGTEAGLTGLKGISDPQGYCDITLPPGDISLESASIGRNLRLGSPSSTLHAKKLTLRGTIVGPGTVSIEAISWLGGGFSKANVTLGATAIFSTGVAVRDEAYVTLTAGGTIRSTSTNIGFQISGGATVHVMPATLLDVRSDVTFSGGSSDVLLNEGTIVFGRADSTNYIRSRFRNTGIFRLATAAYAELSQAEVEEAGRIILESPTTRMRFSSRTSSISKDGMLEGGELEISSSGELRAPADRIKVEHLNLMSGGKLTALSGRGSGITMAKTIKMTGGDLDLAAQVVLPTLVMSSTSSEVFVRPTGHLLVAINFAWQQGSLRAAEGQAAVKVDGELVMSSSTYKYLYGLALQVQGQAAWTQGRLYANDGASFHVLRGGSFEMMSTANMYTNQRGFFLVDGALNVTVCGAEAPLSVPLNVTGTVNVRGSLRLLSGGSMSSAAKVSLLSDGAQFRLGSGMFVAETLAGISGELGSMEVAGGHLVAGSGVLPVLLTLSSGQIEAVRGTVTLAGGLSWSNGNVRLSDGLFLVKRESVWAGGNLYGALSWDGTVTVASTATKNVFGAMTIGSSGVMRHVQGIICVSCNWRGDQNGNLVVRHGGLLVGEPQGDTHLNARTGRFINLGTVTVVSVAEAYQISGLANHGRLIALRGEAKLLGTTEFGPSADVKGTANVTISGSLHVGGRVNLRSPGMLVCDGCNFFVRSAAWLGGNTWAHGLKIYFSNAHCPEADQFTSDSLLQPPCPEAVLTLQGNMEVICSPTDCDFSNRVRIANEGVFTMRGGRADLSGTIENRGVMTMSDIDVYEEYRMDANIVNEVGGVLILEAPERGTTTETMILRAPVMNYGGTIRVEGSRRAYVECVTQTAGSLVVDIADGLRTSSCGVKATGGELTGYGKILQSVSCDGCAFSPGPGRLTVDGDVTMHNATLTTVLRSAMKSDELAVEGTLRLSGAVHHTMPVLDSYVTLGLVDSRVVPVTYESITGEFVSFTTADTFAVNRTLTDTRYVVSLDI